MLAHAAVLGEKTIVFSQSLKVCSPLQLFESDEELNSEALFLQIGYVFSLKSSLDS